jgi:NADH:ubiquinone oxidoreductase subunit 5 (subunit L)/multisubunit Na+/H+ antiporter MnhA subunit
VHHEDIEDEQRPVEDAFDPQDMRTMGGLKDKMPVTTLVYAIGTLALAGIPIFAGFWSKDEILAHAAYNDQFPIIYWILVLAAIVLHSIWGANSRWSSWASRATKRPNMPMKARR